MHFSGTERPTRQAVWQLGTPEAAQPGALAAALHQARAATADGDRAPPQGWRAAGIPTAYEGTHTFMTKGTARKLSPVGMVRFRVALRLGTTLKLA